MTIAILLCLLSGGGIPPRPSGGPPSPSGVVLHCDSLIADALRGNAALRAAGHAREGAQARASGAVWPGPPEFMYLREDMPGEHSAKDVMDRYELIQMLMFPTKLFAERDAARAGAAAAGEDEREKSGEVVRDIRTAYAMLWSAQKEAELNRESEALMRTFASSAATRYGVGAGSQPEVLKANVELAMIRNENATLRRREEEARAMLDALVGLPGRTAEGTAWLPARPAPLPSADSLLALAALRRPMLRADSFMVVESQEMLSKAKQGWLPDLAFGVQYQNMRESDYEGWMLRAGITIPIAPWSLARQSSDVERAEAGLRQAEASYRSSRTMLAASVRSLHAKAAEDRTRLRAFEAEIVPQAGQALEATLRSYQAGGTGFLMLLDSYRTVVGMKREQIMARMEYERSLANLEWAAGTDLHDPAHREEER